MRNIISQQLNAELDKVSPEAKFVDLGADSLDTVEIMMSLEEQFDITLDEEGAENIATVQEAADMIEQFVAQARAPAPLPPATLVIDFHVFIRLLFFIHAENMRGACSTKRGSSAREHRDTSGPGRLCCTHSKTSDSNRLAFRLSISSKPLIASARVAYCPFGAENG